MLESLQNQPQIITPKAAKPAKILRYVENERMGGKVPVWETPKTPKQQIEENLSSAQNGSNTADTNTLLAYNGNINSDTAQSTEFGFGDLIDMVNPLHHIPVVGHVYREISGDDIHPIGQIIGGAVFGGPLGAAGGLVNAIVEEETGKDVAGNAVAMMFDNEIPEFKNPQNDHPQSRLAAAQNIENPAPYNDLPGNLLSFADLKSDPKIKIERVNEANGRTAGTTQRISHNDISLDAMSAREPITQVRLSGLYALNSE